MNIVVRTGDALQEPSALAVVFGFAGEDLPPAVAALFPAADFTGKPNQTLLVYSLGAVAPTRVLLVGLGERSSVTTEGVRQALATAIRQIRPLQVAEAAVAFPTDLPVDVEAAAEAATEGLLLGAYRYPIHRTGLSAEETFEVAEVERRRRHQLRHEHDPQVLDRVHPEHRRRGTTPVVVAARQRAGGHLVDGRREPEPETHADAAVQREQVDVQTRQILATR